MENRLGAIYHAGDAVRLLSPAKANNNTTFVIAGRLFAAFPPVPPCKTWAKPEDLRFHAELQTALASFATFVRSEVQNVQYLHTGMPQLRFFAEAGSFFGRLVKIKNCIMSYFQ
jgi:hypothetical protein